MKILKSLVIVLAMVALVAGATSSVFTSTAKVEGNTFATGKTIQTQVKITLHKFMPVVISKYAVFGDGTANIFWQLEDFADVYLVNWQIQDDRSSAKSLRTKSNTAKITALEPGTLYELSIKPLRGDGVGPEATIVFQTLGNVPIKEIKGTQTPSPAPSATVMPQITPEAAATQKVATTSQATTKVSKETATPAPTPSVTPSPSPTPSPSASPEVSAGGGWNRLLVALSILIIAAGAAIGGYYGYEWLMVRSKDKEPPKSSSRW